jgi:thiamine-phosphate pyrophosphorylase
MNTFAEIRLEYRNRLVLHSHHNLAKALAIHRLHFTEIIEITRKQLETCKQDFTLSTSTHSIEDFNELDPAFDYAFMSPVFTVFLKKTIPKTDLFEQIKKRTNHKTQLIACGISADNIQT